MRFLKYAGLCLALIVTPAFAQVTPGTSPLSIPKGGTGGATAAAARTSLGVTATGADTTYAYRANNLSDLASVPAARTNLGLVIGTNVEAWDADLDCLAALSSTGVIKRSGAGTCSAGTIALSDIAGLGTGVATALGLNIGSAGAPVLFNGAGGTPTSLVLTNGTGLPYAGIASGALATAAQYMAGTASTLVSSNIAFTSETTTTFGATTTFDFSTFINTAVTLTGNITTMTLSNVKAGQAGTIAFIQDGTGSRTTVWSSTLKFAGGVTPTLSTTAAAVDILSYSCRSSSNCVASLILNVK